MKIINKRKIDNFNAILISKRRLIFSVSLFFTFFFVIAYSFLLSFNIYNTYVIKNRKAEMVSKQNINTSLQSDYLVIVSEMEKNIDDNDYKELKKVVYLSSGLNNVAFAK